MANYWNIKNGLNLVTLVLLLYASVVYVPGGGQTYIVPVLEKPLTLPMVALRPISRSMVYLAVLSVLMLLYAGYVEFGILSVAMVYPAAVLYSALLSGSSSGIFGPVSNILNVLIGFVGSLAGYSVGELKAYLLLVLVVLIFMVSLGFMFAISPAIAIFLLLFATFDLSNLAPAFAALGSIVLQFNAVMKRVL